MDRKITNLVPILKSAKDEERVGILEKNLERFIRETLCISDDSQLDRDALFSELGMDSITSVNLKEMINQSLGGSVEMKSEEIFDYPTINKLAKFLAGKV